jgi:hypothetical protein
MAWQPGQPIQTAEHLLEWQEWKRVRKVEGQRYRRTLYRRIDYCEVSLEAAEVIDRELLVAPCATEAVYSAVLNRIVTEWAAHRNKLGPNETEGMPIFSPISQLHNRLNKQVDTKKSKGNQS